MSWPAFQTKHRTELLVNASRSFSGVRSPRGACVNTSASASQSTSEQSSDRRILILLANVELSGGYGATICRTPASNRSTSWCSRRTRHEPVHAEFGPIARRRSLRRSRHVKRKFRTPPVSSQSPSMSGLPRSSKNVT